MKTDRPAFGLGKEADAKTGALVLTGRGGGGFGNKN
jgi:hypothetical protein